MTTRFCFDLLWLAALFCSVLQTEASFGSTVSLRFSSSLQKILREPGVTAARPGKYLFPHLSPTCTLLAARNEYESFQLIITNLSGASLKDVTIRVRPERNAPEAPAVELYWEHYVFVDHPSGNRIDVPLWYPDALIPLAVQKYRRLAPGESEVVWGCFHIPPTVKPMTYTYRLIVTDGEDRELSTATLSLQVVAATIPVTRHFKATAALYYDVIRDYYNKHYRESQPPLRADEEEWKRIKTTFYEFLLDYRFIAYDLPVAVNSPEARKFLHDPRVSCFRLPWLGDDILAFGNIISSIVAVLPKAFYYQADEPTIPQYPDVIELAARLRSVNRMVKHLVTIDPVLPLLGSVDIWCPSLGSRLTNGSMNLPRLRLRRRLGEETWWYTMTIPRYPYPTWLVDDDAIAHRIFFWMSSLYGFTGCVYSMVHGWSEDPYASVRSFLGSNGDGLLLYPGVPFGSASPFPSIRLMILRDGIEDYELLWQLRPSDRRKACRALVQDLTRWSRSPERMMWVRRQILELLSRRRHLLQTVNYRQADWLSPKTTVGIKETGRAPVVDGELNPREWSDAVALKSFRKCNGLQLAGAHTCAWMKHDGKNLFVAARCSLPAVDLTDPWKHQWFALAIDPGRRRDRYFFFVVTARGNSHTELRSAEGIDPTCSIPWEHKSRTATGQFTVEMRIPFSGFGHSPCKGEVWGFNLHRRSGDEFSSFQADFGDVTLMPGIRF